MPHCPYVLGDLAVDVRHEGGGAEVIDVVEADIIVLFSHHFPWGWHGFAIVSGRGLTSVCGFSHHIFTVANCKYFILLGICRCDLW